MHHLTHILYLHGFRSSPRSVKSQKLGAAVAEWNTAWHAARVAEHMAKGLATPGTAAAPPAPAVLWAAPQLPPSPALAVSQLQALVANWPRDTMAVIGSSLGGFYATGLAEQLGCRAAVINPAVAPARDLARYIGEQSTFDKPEDRFFFRPEFIDEFRALSPYPITRPDRYWALIAKGDEVLDWREMAAHYPDVALTLIEGSDHAVSDFDAHMPGLLAWLGLR
jgi:predicted esterase YcpF (UPF0227 family)